MSQRFELSAALLYFLIAPLVAGEAKEVVARWEELAPLIEKREIETMLANGVHIRGRVEKVLAEALEVRVKRTSEPKTLPKGSAHVPRDLFTVITVRWRQGRYRILLPIAFLAGGSGLLSAARVGIENPYLASLVGAGLIAVGYRAGAEIDRKELRVILRPGGPRNSSPVASLVSLARQGPGYESETTAGTRPSSVPLEADDRRSSAREPPADRPPYQLNGSKPEVH